MPGKFSPTNWLVLALSLGCLVYALYRDLGPGVGPPPISGEGLKVLVVEDLAKRPTLPVSQQVIFASEEVQNYLTTHCAKSSDGSPGYRFIPKGTNMKDAPKEWQDAMARPRKEEPWIVISNGKGGTEGPLPIDEASTIAELKKWGGP